MIFLKKKSIWAGYTEKAFLILHYLNLKNLLWHPFDVFVYFRPIFYRLYNNIDYFTSNQHEKEGCRPSDLTPNFGPFCKLLKYRKRGNFKILANYI